MCPKCGRPYGQRKRCYHCNPPRKRTGATSNCLTCGTIMYVQPNQAASGEGRYCSIVCKASAQRGVELAQGTRYLRPDGYVAVKVGIRSYQLEHRIIAEHMLGRPLATSEHVHHINGDKQDNRPENLLVLSNDEHQKLHDWRITKHRRIEKACERCGAPYLVKRSKAAASRFCSNACRLAALHEGNRKE